MDITRNSTGTFSLFVPMRYERLGKYGFRVQFVGCVSDDDLQEAVDGVVDWRYRKQFTVSAALQARGHNWEP